MSVWVVWGYTGEYSGFLDWAVCYYDNKEDALDHAEKAREEYLRLYREAKKKGLPLSIYIHDGNYNSYDPEMHTSYTETHYDVEELVHGSELKK